MSVRGLKLRLKRLEEKRRKTRTGVPTQDQFLEANACQQTRRLYNAKSRLMGEDRVWRNLSERDQNFISDDISEQQAKDADVEERWRQVHAPIEEEISGVTAQIRTKLRDITRVTLGVPE